MSSKGSIFVLSGPSGCGKNTVYDALTKITDNIAQTISVTTRSPRTGETDGVDYYFVSVDDFQKKLENNEFIEYVKYGNNYYGTLKSEVERIVSEGKNVILVIEVIGAAKIKEVYPDSVSIFILPPSVEELRKRILSRGENSDEEIDIRLEIAVEEIKLKDNYDHCVINDDLDECVNEILHILNSVR